MADPPGIKSVFGGKGKSKKWLIIGGGVAVVAIVVETRKRSAASAAAVADPAATAATDPAYNAADPYGTQNYSDPYGTAQYAQGYYQGSGGGFPAAVATPAAVPDAAVAVAPPITTNAQWAAAATDQMALEGFDRMTASSAIGQYLSGQALTPDALSLVQTALGLLGNPPAGAPAPHAIPAAPAVPPPAKAPVKPTFPNGYYKVITTGAFFSVAANVRYPIGPSSWSKIAATKPKVTQVLPNSVLMQLPLGPKI